MKDSRKLPTILKINSEIEWFRTLLLWNHDLTSKTEHYNLLAHGYNTAHILLTNENQIEHFNIISVTITDIALPSPSKEMVICLTDLQKTVCMILRAAVHYMLIFYNHCSFQNLKKNKAQSKLTYFMLHQLILFDSNTYMPCISHLPCQ